MIPTQQYNPMVTPEYDDATLITDKFQVAGPTLIFGCGTLTHEKLLLNFYGSELVLYDPDPFNLVPPNIHFNDRLFPILKTWQGVKEINSSYNSIVCFFSLHYVPQWLDRLWELYGMLKAGGQLFIAEDAGFRALLDGNYDLRSGVVDRNVIRRVWQSFSERLEGGYPWYPDISASNMTQVREALAPYYDFDSQSDFKMYELKRKVSDEERLGSYLPWNEKAWGLDGISIASINIKSIASIVREQIKIYRLTKRSNVLPPLWELLHGEFMNDFWSKKLMYCNRTLVRNTPDFGGGKDKVEEIVGKLFKIYLTVIYQHLLRHLPTGSMELVSLYPRRFYDFYSPNIAGDDGYLKKLPVVSWNEEELGISFVHPSWYVEYIRQLDEQHLEWGGKTFFADNSVAFTYLLRDDWGEESFPDKYYCAHFYSEMYCRSYGYQCSVGNDWDQRQLPPLIYVTVESSRRKDLTISSDNEQSQILARHRELKYVGSVLYRGNGGSHPIQRVKYLLIGGLISHLTAYIQAQTTTCYGVVALTVSVPENVKKSYDKVDLNLINDAYDNLFPLTQKGSFVDQHNIESVTADKTKNNLGHLGENIKKGLEDFCKNLNEPYCTGSVNDDACAKCLKAVLSRHKDSFYLFDLYCSLIYQSSNKASQLRKILRNVTEDNSRIRCETDYAFWKIRAVMEEFIKRYQDFRCYYGERSILIASSDNTYPSIFEKDAVSGGSYGSYARLLRETHPALFKYDHKLFHIKTAKLVLKNSSLPKLLSFIGHPAFDKTSGSVVPHLSHLFMENVYDDKDRQLYNGLLLRNYDTGTII